MKKLYWVLLICGVIAVAGGTIYYWQVLRPYSQLFSPENLDTLPIQEQRELCHQLLSGWIYHPDHHDVYILLSSVGDSTSIPLLIEALRHEPPGAGPMDCTKVHCLEALRQLTGVNAGTEYESWRAWWEAHRATFRDSSPPVPDTTS